MTEMWVQDILARQAEGPMADAHDMQLFMELSDLVQRRDLEYLRKADLTDSIPYRMLGFLKKLTLRWNRGDNRFHDPELQKKLVSFLAAADDLDLELFKNGHPMPGQPEHMTLVKPVEKRDGKLSEVTMHNLAQVREKLRAVWERYLSLDRTAHVRLNMDG